MKKMILTSALVWSVLTLFAQRNEFRILVSSDIFETTFHDFLPNDQQFSLGLEYAKPIAKRFDLEAGLLYSKSGFAEHWCDICDIILPYYSSTKELNATLGLRWRFIENEQVALYTSAGFQGNRKLASGYPGQIPEEDHFSGAVYQDLGFRFKLYKSFSIDFELKGRYNLKDQSSIYYDRNDFKLGAGIGFNYAF